MPHVVTGASRRCDAKLVWCWAEAHLDLFKDDLPLGVPVVGVNNHDDLL